MSAPSEHMRLEVFTPTALLVDDAAVKVIAEGPEGYFAVLPRHIDLAAALTPGLLVYVTAAGEERLLGIDEGVPCTTASSCRAPSSPTCATRPRRRSAS